MICLKRRQGWKNDCNLKVVLAQAITIELGIVLSGWDVILGQWDVIHYVCQ